MLFLSISSDRRARPLFFRQNLNYKQKLKIACKIEKKYIHLQPHEDINATLRSDVVT